MLDREPDVRPADDDDQYGDRGAKHADDFIAALSAILGDCQWGNHC
jgi:hypothetical protein